MEDIHFVNSIYDEYAYCGKRNIYKTGFTVVLRYVSCKTCKKRKKYEDNKGRRKIGGLMVK